MSTTRKSLDEISITDQRLAELAALAEKEIDTSDIPELDDNFWKNAKVEHPSNKTRLTIRFDADIVEWFKAQGKGYQSRMNAVLRSYYEAHEHKNPHP